MTKVCVIGDSHIGALRRAASNVDPQLALTFFAGHAERVDWISVSGRALVTSDDEGQQQWQRTSGGHKSIAVDAYDCFVITGLGFGLGPSHAGMEMEQLLHELYGRFHSDSMPGPAGEKYRVSDDCFITAAEGLLEDRHALRVAGMIRSLCDKPILVLPAPNPSAGFNEADLPDRFAPLFAANRNGDADALRVLFEAVCERLSRSRHVQIIPPPREVAENGLFNRREFCMLPADDGSVPYHEMVKGMTHGNARLGAILWSKIQEAIRPAML